MGLNNFYTLIFHRVKTQMVLVQKSHSEIL